MPLARRKTSYAKGSPYPEFDGPYPLALCVVAWVIVLSIVLAAIFGFTAFAISFSAAIASAFTAPRD